MSSEVATLVLITRAQWSDVLASLATDAELAARRQLKAPPGDRQEALRYDAICRQLEQVALALASKGKAEAVTYPAEPVPAGIGHAWISQVADLPSEFRGAKVIREHLDRGGIVVEIRDPFAVGSAELPLPSRRSKAASPASPWRPGKGSRTRNPQQVLWEEQLAAVVSGKAHIAVPSGVNNVGLTNGLRRYVDKPAGVKKASARIVYRDGSEARPFPLASLDLHTLKKKELASWRVWRVVLLSMRHPEMDPDVDAAWLRNRMISQVRPAGETDGLVYEISTRKLRELTANGPLLLDVFQTGLEPAVVGFYRAVVHHLQKRPESLVVRPQHFRKSTEQFESGLVWAASK